MTDAVPTYEDDIGWARVDAVLTPEAAFALAARCDAVAEGLDDPRSGPGPGTGGQQLHADDLPRLDAAEPYRSA